MERVTAWEHICKSRGVPWSLQRCHVVAHRHSVGPLSPASAPFSPLVRARSHAGLLLLCTGLSPVTWVVTSLEEQHVTQGQVGYAGPGGLGELQGQEDGSQHQQWTHMSSHRREAPLCMHSRAPWHPCPLFGVIEAGQPPLS